MKPSWLPGSVVLPLEGHATVFQRNQTLVGDGDVVGIARQYSHLSRSAEERFGIDDRFGPSDLAERFDKVPPLSQGLQLADETRVFDRGKAVFKYADEFGPEEAAERP